LLVDAGIARPSSLSFCSSSTTACPLAWLNQVERWFALRELKALKRGVHRSTLDLEKAIYEFIEAQQ
jgi:hypothetical protein